MSSRIYKIYEYPGYKIGATYQPLSERDKQNRFKFKKKGIDLPEIILLEQSTDLEYITKRELELQEDRGYPKETQNYITALKRQKLGTIAAQSLEAKAKKSKSTKGREMPWLHNPEVRKKIGKASYKRQKGKRPNQLLTPESIKKSAQSRKGIKLTWLQKPEVRKKAAKKISIPVYQFSKDGKFIKKWQSAFEVKQALGIDNANIGSCCKGYVKSAGGYIWKYTRK